MTKLFVISFLMWQAVANAYPAVHDRAVYSGRVLNSDGTHTPFKLEFELVEASAGSFKQKITLVEGDGPAQVQEVWVPATELPASQTVIKLVTNCRDINGISETLPLGSSALYTCALPTQQQNSQGTTWIADVPFGVAKAVMNSKTDSRRTEITLVKFHAAP